jgi:tRNA (adenine37-N6)-methyltransferase
MELTLKPIGVIRTPYTQRAPYQPLDDDEGDFRVVVNAEYVSGIQNLIEFRYMYVLYYVDRVKGETPLIVAPPWAGGLGVGVFASRSPDRPNPIGLSIVRIKEIAANVIFTSGLDVFDRTPLLDIKPYIKDLDSKDDANYGWIDRLENRDHLMLHILGIPHDY